MNYKSYSDLDECIRSNLWQVPRDVDLVVGIPRSGLMAASIIALYLNLPFTDVDGLLAGRLLGVGRRLKHLQVKSILESARKVLIVDDSCSSGYEINRNKALLTRTGFGDRCLFAAVYATSQAINQLDIHLEICPLPRMFAWNLMHHTNLEKACVDIDGVLCVDPTHEQNDDGERYLDFLRMANPLVIPTVRIGALVTCRLERYRNETVKWLSRHGVAYDELVMWDLPSKEARMKQGGHGSFKGDIYKNRPWADIFVESSYSQALDIANVSLKPVICIENQEVVMPSLQELMNGALRKTPKALSNRLSRYSKTAKEYLLEKLRH